MVSWGLRQALDQLWRQRQGRPIPIKAEEDWDFMCKNGKCVKSYRRAFDEAAKRAGIAERDKQHNEKFTPHCYRRSAISRWELLMPTALARACSGHSPADTHQDYIQLTDEELIAAFDKAGLLSPPPVGLEEEAVNAA